MNRNSARQREIAASTRARIIQRILVDSWTPAEAASFFAVDEHRVRRWIRDYRRRGMASLRCEPPTDNASPHWVTALRVHLAGMFRAGLLGTPSREPPGTEPAPCVVLHLGGTERRRG